MGPPTASTPFTIGVCGGSGSGKTTLAQQLANGLGPNSTQVISFDSYYRPLDHLSRQQRAAVNFDHPDSLDAELLATQLDGLRAGRSVAVPTYDFDRHTRSDEVHLIDPAPFIVVEGILLCAFDSLVDRFDLLLFRRCDEQTRFQRRLERDVTERGRTPESVRQQFFDTVKPMHDEFVEQAVERCDVVIEDGDIDAATQIALDAVRAATGTAPHDSDAVPGSQAPVSRH